MISGHGVLKTAKHSVREIPRCWSAAHLAKALCEVLPCSPDLPTLALTSAHLSTQPVRFRLRETGRDDRDGRLAALTPHATVANAVLPGGSRRNNGLQRPSTHPDAHPIQMWISASLHMAFTFQIARRDKARSIHACRMIGQGISVAAWAQQPAPGPLQRLAPLCGWCATRLVSRVENYVPQRWWCRRAS